MFNKRKHFSDLKPKLVFVAIIFCLLVLFSSISTTSSTKYKYIRVRKTPFYINAPILISYSITNLVPDAWNVEYFLQAGMKESPTRQHIRWIIVDLHPVCAACSDVFSNSENLGPYPPLNIIESYRAGPATLLYRSRNDKEMNSFLSYHISLEYSKYRGDFNTFKYFIFLDNTARGPFMPAYMPDTWHWTYGFLNRMGGIRNDKVVAATLTCKPESDLDAFGPQLDTYIFAVEASALEVLIKEDVFMYCGTCLGDLNPEPALTESLLVNNISFTVLMSRYDRNTDWQNKRNWHCNNNIPPAMHGMYDGISVHPFEVMFVKNTWGVAEPYVRRYSDWFFQHLEYDMGTRGNFDEKMYRYAISAEAQAPNNLEEAFSYVSARATNYMGVHGQQVSN